MTVRRKYTRSLVAAESVYLDPLHANSTASYKVISSKGVWGSVKLTDCSDSIEWYFGTVDQIDKIDKAVDMLLAFKEAFIAANKARCKRKRRPVRK